MVGFLDIHTTMLRFMYGIEREDDNSKKSAIFSAAVIHAVCLGLLFLTVYITQLLTTFPYAREGLFYGITFTLSTFFLNCARGMDKEVEYTTGFSIFHLSNLILMSLLLMVFRLGANAIFISFGLAYLIQIFYLESKIHVLRMFSTKYIRPSLIKRMLRFTFPLAFTAVGTWVMKNYCSIIIVKILGSKENGLYTMALNFARAIPTIANGLIIAWQEVAFSTRGKQSSKREFFQNSLEQVLIIFSCTYMLFIPAIHLILPYYLDPAYQSIMPLIALCTAGFLFDCFSLILAGVFGNSINSMPIMISTIVGTITDLLLIHFFINTFGTLGAAITTCIGFFLVVSIRMIWLSVEHHFHMHVVKILFYFVAATIIGYYATIGSVQLNALLIVVSLALSLPYIRPMVADHKKKSRAEKLALKEEENEE